MHSSLGRHTYHLCHSVYVLQGFNGNILLVLVVTVTTVLGLPMGAPEQACSTITPVGHTAVNNMASGSVPFNVDISSINSS